jgi:hypothetical protein
MSQQQQEMFWSHIHFWTSAFECHKMEITNLGSESFLPPISVPSMWETEVDILWGISWSDSCSGIHVLHSHRQQTCSRPMWQTLLHGRMNAALTGSMTLLSNNTIHYHDGDRWLLPSLSMTSTWPLPHLYEHHICTKQVAQSVCGCSWVMCFVLTGIR